ncbi:hemerythrin domain-containing protein [Williamsia serinedens]|uniref:Hemerythrin HHE cation binding domain-containing protein n=1 Tax=Williamsia serinedens TaxID=391736 RepID=A0ABT1H4J9_9NOCA|nr:hemerythrin domain-containing protein [Williamsia serinedens]MCP2162167.1 Hemerythrin HHE cation binding domain-containing protein [Williamsia serinedens]
MTSIAHRPIDELGGPTSVLVRQRTDHVELDHLIRAAHESHGVERQKTVNRLCRLVFPHAFAGESVLWPVIRRVVPDGEAQTLEIEREHQQINELFTELERTEPDSIAYDDLFAQITDLLRQDVRDEEDSLFPELRDALDDRDLRRLGWVWLAVRRTAPTRPHPVVARRPPGNALAALPLTVIDRSRDGLDQLALRAPSRLAARASAGLASLAGGIERIGVLRVGERPDTHITDTHSADAD